MSSLCAHKKTDAMGQKHFIRLHRVDQSTGKKKFHDVTLKDWSRENQHFFPRFGFTNSQSDIPTTHQIRDFLRSSGFRQFEENARIILTHEDENLFRGHFL